MAIFRDNFVKHDLIASTLLSDLSTCLTWSGDVMIHTQSQTLDFSFISFTHGVDIKKKKLSIN